MSRYTDSLLADLANGEWVCGSHWYATYRPTFAQRFSEINAKEPGRIESRPCQQHDHNVYEYRDTFALLPKQLAWQAA